MVLEFTPLSEDEILKSNLLEEGIYDFSILHAEEKISQAGNKMIELCLQVADGSGLLRRIFDYLILNEKWMFKIRHCCDCLGMIDKYDSGKLYAEDFLDKEGKVEIYIQEDKTGKYGPKNAVKDYVKRLDLKVENVSIGERNEGEFDDDIPF